MSLKGKIDKWVDWNDPNILQEAISKSNSRVGTLRTLGYSHSGPSKRKLNAAIKKFNLDTSSFDINSDRWKILPNIIKECFTITDVLTKVGLKPIGGNCQTAKKYIKLYNLNTDHFKSVNIGGSKPKYTFNEIFRENSPVTRRTTKNYIIKHNLIEYKCEKCGLINSWESEKLVLQLEHKNGINNDNRLENLCFLCPNCHSQTETFSGKKQNNINRC